MSGLEALFDKDGRLPLEIAERLSFSIGLKSEFEYVLGGNFPKFPKLSKTNNKKKWNVKIPFLWILNFNRMLERAWSDSFLIFVDRKNRDLEKAELKLKKEYGNTSKFRDEWIKTQLEILGEAVDDTAVSVTGKGGSYDYILEEASNFSNRILRSENQEIINLALATFGAYISDCFDKKMQSISNSESTRGKLYWKECIFRYQLMRDLLNKFFMKIEGNMKGYREESEPFLNPDIALIEKKFDKGKLVNYLLYGQNVYRKFEDIIDYHDYKIIRSEISHCVEDFDKGSCKGVYDEKQKAFIKEILEKTKKAEIPYDKGLDILVHDPQIVDAVLADTSTAVLSKISYRGIKRLEDRVEKYKLLSRQIKLRDFLMLVFDAIDYSYFLNVPSLPNEEKQKRLDEEIGLYNDRKLFDFTGDKPIFLSEMEASIWYFDVVSSRAIKKNIGSEEANKIYQQLFLKDEDGDKSLANDIVSDYSGEEYIASRGDDRGFVIPGKHFVLSSFSTIEDFYKAFEEERKPLYVETLKQKCPTINEFGFRSGFSIGQVNIDARAKHLNARPAERAVDLSDRELYVKVKIGEKELEEIIENESRILFSADLDERRENILDRLRKDLNTIQSYIHEKRFCELKEELPAKLYEKIEEKIKEDPNTNLILKDCEELIAKLPKEKRAVDDKRTLDYYVKEYLYKVHKDVSKYQRDTVIGVIRHFCSMYNAYQTDLFGEKPVIMYRGKFAGIGGGRKNSDANFDVYSFLPTEKQTDKFISRIVEKCYEELNKIYKKKNGKQ